MSVVMGRPSAEAFSLPSSGHSFPTNLQNRFKTELTSSSYCNLLKKWKRWCWCLNQDGNVVTPDRVFSEMYTKAGDHFHSCSTDLQGRKLVFVPSKKHTHLLFFFLNLMQRYYTCTTSAVVYPLPVVRIIVVVEA